MRVLLCGLLACCFFAVDQSPAADGPEKGQLGRSADDVAVSSAHDDCERAGLAEGKDGLLCGHAEAQIRQFEVESVERLLGLAAAGDTDVLSYNVDIELTPEYSGSTPVAVKIGGTVTMEVSSAVAGLTTMPVDLLSNMSVLGVTGNVASWTHSGDVINVTLDQAYGAGETFTIAVTYEGYPASGSTESFEWGYRNGQVMVATLSEPYFARYWWPCKDALDDKATFTIAITVPQPLIAASNGKEMGVDVLTGNRRRFRYSSSTMIPYLFSLAVADYARYELVYEYGASGRDQFMPVVCWLYSDHWNEATGEPYSSYKTGCDELLDMINVMTDDFGAYPFLGEKYAVAETGRLLGPSMEHQTVSSMYRVNSFSNIMAHELAHHWWGDEVTCQTWYDIWLNEGFASFGEALYQEGRIGGGASAYWGRMQDRRPASPDARVYRDSISSVYSIFSSNDVYNKGAWVVHMLRGVLGDAAFFEALADYRTAFADDSATTAELAASIAASVGHDMDWFFDEWVMNPGAPAYRWNYAFSNFGSQHLVKLRVNQLQSQSGYDLFTMPMTVRVTTSSGVETHRIWNNDWEEYYVLAVDDQPLSVTIDEDNGVAGRNWILSESLSISGTPVSAPPVIVGASVQGFTQEPGQAVVVLTFSEAIAHPPVSVFPLVGPSQTTYLPSSVTAPNGHDYFVEYNGLPTGEYVLTVDATQISANGKNLDGEIEAGAWYDATLLPSGDGQSGGDAVLAISRRLGDFNSDGVITADDVLVFDECLNGPGSPPPSYPGSTQANACVVFDLNADGDVDLSDYAALTAAME